MNSPKRLLNTFQNQKRNDLFKKNYFPNINIKKE